MIDWSNTDVLSPFFGGFVMAERRQIESSRIRDKYPDRIPVMFLLTFVCLYFSVYVLLCSFNNSKYMLQVIVERAERSDVPNIDKKKWVLMTFFFCSSFLLTTYEFYASFVYLWVPCFEHFLEELYLCVVWDWS